MDIQKLMFRGSSCFLGEWVGFDSFKPINVVIGRNNTGKSQLLDLVQICCEGFKSEVARPWDFLCEGVALEQDLRNAFPQHHSGGEMHGDHWLENGVKLVGATVRWERGRANDIRNVEVFGGRIPALRDAHKGKLAQVVSRAETPLSSCRFSHLLADRDIQSEPPTTELVLRPDGRGATNVIRRHITSSSPDLPRERIQRDLRDALNKIFGQDGHFTEIQVQQHDESNEGDLWEVYLAEETKGLVSLSDSGSGLKTVILVLLHLLVMPKVNGKELSKMVFAFEELENNLHPALLRRLMGFIERFALANKVRVFMTTHSSATLDLFGALPHAQIVHVTHDGRAAKTQTVDAHFDRLAVLGELGAKPSDLLQANGVIWVEGPSDAIYLNRWVELMSDGELREGRHYSCAFYGGALLARAQFVSPEEAEDDLINLLTLNPNIFVVCDGDRRSPGAHLKKRVIRIRDEVAKVPGGEVWITRPKEIECYLPGKLIAQALDMKGVARDVGEYEQFFSSARKDGSSYVESVLSLHRVDKMELAVKSSRLCEREDMTGQFDWESQIKRVISAVRRWNS